MNTIQTVYLRQTEYKVPPVVHAVQGDTGRQLKMVIADRTVPADTTAELAFIRSDKSHYTIDCGTVDTTDNSFTCPDLTQALTQAGNCNCQLKVAGIVSTFSFVIDVEPDTAGISREQDGWNVEDITNRLDAVEEAIDSTIAFTIALPFSGWSENTQTVSNAGFVASGFSYIVSASPDDLADYSESAIYADDVTTDGSMTFHCEDEPTTDITVNIVRMKVG